jgi:hypothetical protein
VVSKETKEVVLEIVGIEKTKDGDAVRFKVRYGFLDRKVDCYATCKITNINTEPRNYKHRGATFITSLGDKDRGLVLLKILGDDDEHYETKIISVKQRGDGNFFLNASPFIPASDRMYSINENGVLSVETPEGIIFTSEATGKKGEVVVGIVPILRYLINEITVEEVLAITKGDAKPKDLSALELAEMVLEVGKAKGGSISQKLKHRLTWSEHRVGELLKRILDLTSALAAAIEATQNGG